MSILDYSTTPGDNTAISGIGITGNNLVSNFDNAFRQIMADIASGIVAGSFMAVGYVSKATTYSVVVGDKAKMIDCTAALELDLPAAATAGAGFFIWVKANGGAVTVDPNSTENINGASTSLTIANGSAALVVCTGTGWHSISMVASGAGYLLIDGTRAMTGNLRIQKDYAQFELYSPDASENWTIQSGSEDSFNLGLFFASTVGGSFSNVYVLPPLGFAWFAYTYAATLTFDHRAYRNVKTTMTGNPTIAAPTNPQLGEVLTMWLVQDGTGSRVPTFNSVFDFGDAGTPTLSTGASQADILAFQCLASDKWAFLGIRKRVD